MLLSEGAALGFLAAGVVPEGVDDDLLLGFPLVGLGELLFGKLGAGFGGVTAWIVAAAVVVLLGVVAWWIARRG